MNIGIKPIEESSMKNTSKTMLLVSDKIIYELGWWLHKWTGLYACIQVNSDGPEKWAI